MQEDIDSEAMREAEKKYKLREHYDPSSMFRSGELDDDFHLIQNPMHMHSDPFASLKEKVGELNTAVQAEMQKYFKFVYDYL